jgi:homoserine O-acetyltransferase
MTSDISETSVGLVTAEKILIETPLTLACGVVLPSHELMVETYGSLNADKSNALLICHALSGGHHAAGFYPGDEKPGWWDSYIGPGKPMDTNRFFIVSLNNIGSCFGSTGPTSINPESDEPWGAEFPVLRQRLGGIPAVIDGAPRHSMLGGGYRRQPRRYAGDALGAGIPR